MSQDIEHLSFYVKKGRDPWWVATFYFRWDNRKFYAAELFKSFNEAAASYEHLEKEAERMVRLEKEKK